MSFSKKWEEIYKSGQHLNTWPWSDLISYVMRYSRPSSKSYKVLELGCGGGANLPFFNNLGVEYYAIDGSDSATKFLSLKYPQFESNIVSGDFTKEIPFDVKFDLVVDRAALTHNSTEAISRSLSLIKACLNPNGKFIGIDWFSTQHSDFEKGIFTDDSNTKTNIQEGQFKGLGKVHFSDKNHILDLFKDFMISQLEHKIVHREIPMDKHIFASWNFVAFNK